MRQQGRTFFAHGKTLVPQTKTLSVRETHSWFNKEHWLAVGKPLSAVEEHSLFSNQCPSLTDQGLSITKHPFFETQCLKTWLESEQNVTIARRALANCLLSGSRSSEQETLRADLSLKKFLIALFQLL
jgi:hypothetical protein